MKFLMMAMIASRSSQKSINVTWLRYFDEGKAASQIAYGGLFGLSTVVVGT